MQFSWSSRGSRSCSGSSCRTGSSTMSQTADRRRTSTWTSETKLVSGYCCSSSSGWEDTKIPWSLDEVGN
jgi:hypothetical protein